MCALFMDDKSDPLFSVYCCALVVMLAMAFTQLFLMLRCSFEKEYCFMWYNILFYFLSLCVLGSSYIDKEYMLVMGDKAEVMMFLHGICTLEFLIVYGLLYLMEKCGLEFEGTDTEFFQN